MQIKSVEPWPSQGGGRWTVALRDRLPFVRRLYSGVEGWDVAADQSIKSKASLPVRDERCYNVGMQKEHALAMRHT